jgi:3-dehydroquinate synthase
VGQIRLQFSTVVDYGILAKPGGLSQLPHRLRDLGLGPQVVILTDETVNSIYGRDLQRLLQSQGFRAEIVAFPAGEQHKNLTTVSRIYQALQEIGADRSTVVVALGGGVVGDIAGVVAATWQRGLRLVQVPTTLLAQVDSSLGGKAAVNHLGLKNFVGVFKHPQLVLTDGELLRTLPDREYATGLAEVVKTALLGGPEFWAYLLGEQRGLLQRDSAVLAQVIKRCVAYKAAVVSRDPEDRGERRVLNLGHTLGHAIEELAGKRFSHGQAVSVGLCFALQLSQAIGLPGEVLEQARAMLQGFGLPVRAPGLEVEQVLDLIPRDKKAVGGITRWVLLGDVGRPLITPDLPADWQQQLLSLL